jgi:ABC-type branched-subunit amino acid transport system ATPase component
MEKADMAWFIKEMGKRGMGIIFIDHHMDMVMNLADRVVVLHQGTIIADGSPGEVSEDAEVIRAYLGPRKGEVSFPAISGKGSRARKIGIGN